MNYFNFKRYKFSTITKSFSSAIYKALKFIKFKDFKIYTYRNYIKRSFNFEKVKNFFYYKKFNLRYFKKINFRYFTKFNFIYFKRIKFTKNRVLIVHIPAAIIFFSFLYLIIPTFYNYNPKSFGNAICESKKIECIIKGKINYRFYPSPRIKIKKLVIKDLTNNKESLIVAEKILIKLSIQNLLAKDKHQFKKIELGKFKINQDLKNIASYEEIFKNKINLILINFKKGDILFFNKKNYIATISDANLKIKLIKDLFHLKLNGNFLDDKLSLDWKIKDIDNTKYNETIFKMSNMNFVTKIKYEKSYKKKGIKNGNISIKKERSKINAIFDYFENKLIIKKSNLRNAFVDGKLIGKIDLLPYFKFDLDLTLNSLNFTKLYNYFLSLNEVSQKNIFRINNKINGSLSLSSDKVYSSNNLIKSFESRVKFSNGNISIDQFLLNLGKLGAADLIGSINNEKKYTNLKYESNIFIDNKKKFISKFGIYNKKDISDNMYVSGNFDLLNIKNSFYEIEGNEKLKIEDVNFIEKEFNSYMLSEEYKELFLFKKFKQFIKSITTE